MKKKQESAEKQEPQKNRGRKNPEKNKESKKPGRLSFSEKRRLSELRRTLAGKGRGQAVPDTAQKTITFQKMYRDGICQVTNAFYTRMVEFYDINYDLLEQSDQEDILVEYSRFINYFDPSIKFELFLFNRQVNEAEMCIRDRCITAETMLDGAPDAVKVACPVLTGGKAGDNIKGLPIGTFRLSAE